MSGTTSPKKWSDQVRDAAQRAEDAADDLDHEADLAHEDGDYYRESNLRDASTDMRITAGVESALADTLDWLGL